MRRNTACLFLFGSLLSISGMAQTKVTILFSALTHILT